MLEGRKHTKNGYNRGFLAGDKKRVTRQTWRFGGFEVQIEVNLR